jgi:translation initiation factor 2 alpha subunit (eIF-2alpha)
MNNVKLNDLPVIWRYNKKAWMTSEIFSEWLNEVNRRMKRANRKILLFVDNARNHVDLNLYNFGSNDSNQTYRTFRAFSGHYIFANKTLFAVALILCS